MNKEQSEKLKQLILNEMSLRSEFREQREKLESLVSPISKHVKECCMWWETNLPDTSEIIIIFDNKTTLKLNKPKMEDCSVESYLPFGIDFSECKIVDINS